MQAEKIFVRETKTGYVATYNGVIGKAKTMYKAIERAQKKWLMEQPILPRNEVMQDESARSVE